MTTSNQQKIQVGVDTGGTFTDVVCYFDGLLKGTIKLPSTPGDPSKAIHQALCQLEIDLKISLTEIDKFCHGTTVATNSLIERKGGQVGILATKGFTDVIEIGRQMRRQLYEVALITQSPVFLAPGKRRKGVIERIASDGTVLTSLDEASVIKAVQELVDDGVETIAICFLFSFLNPTHEILAQKLITSTFPNLKVSISSNVDPTFREYERTVVTAFDAYLKPVVDNYLSSLDSELKRKGLKNEPKIMKSRGAMSAISIARQLPVQLFLSGPAAGVVGAANIGKAAKIKDLISVDIGGTSCDIAVIKDGRPTLRAEGEIENFPVRVNMVDVNAIGAGGGSLVWIDSAGGLRVGPDSAGAHPGPACYGLGGERATVTDASVVLGFINPDYFAGGSLPLYRQKAIQTIDKTVASKLNCSIERAAQGIHQVVNTQMAEGVRLLSTQRGLDPREFTLVALGGAGPIHAAALADELEVEKIIVPCHPGVLSAMGLLTAPIEHEVTIAVQKKFADLSPTFISGLLKRLDEKCYELMKAEGVTETQKTHIADICYVGQSHHLGIKIRFDNQKTLDHLKEDFKIEHDQLYGHAADSPVKLINLRAIHSFTEKQKFEVLNVKDKTRSSLKGQRSVLFLNQKKPQITKIHERKYIQPGTKIAGPAIIEQADTTVVIPDGWQAIIKKTLDMVMHKEKIL